MTTRQKLIDSVAEVMREIPKLDVASAVEIMFEYIGKALSKSERAEIRGFGSFKVGERIIAPSTNLNHVLYHHRKIKTINYRMPEVLRKKLNE